MNKIGIFASGTGTNADKLLSYLSGHDIVVVTNDKGAGVIDVAKETQGRI